MGEKKVLYESFINPFLIEPPRPLPQEMAIPS